MKLSPQQLGVINLVIQFDQNGNARTYDLSELDLASKIFAEIKKNVDGENFVEGEVKFTSEQKVFITRGINERKWTVADSDAVFELKKLLK